ncbi:DUF3800 domain-containing protein [Leucobacter komagatae]|uniref:DUF3800 domain-containing protein n=1 Tax=Leucobacter komagatae TaxID=55969 RepID=A0A0D0IP69_9MICO|nr:DUF3800 domain-containing protein [Leucobacter komagatae]KIP52867.1 hypothetical protein SD72_06655 [Leucobacter komagatae]
MVELIYIDETGSSGKGAKNQPLLTLAAVIVPETQVQPLAVSLKQLASKHLGGVPKNFEFHGVEVWGGAGHWKDKTPECQLAAFRDVIDLLATHEIQVAYASIHKSRLHRKYNGSADANSYLLAMQFLLEKIEKRGSSELKIVVADEAKEHQSSAIKLVSDLQSYNLGVVPGRKLERVIDSVHFARSSDSPGVQLADMVAFALQRKQYKKDSHPNAVTALNGIYEAIISARLTYRDVWPSGS